MAKVANIKNVSKHNFFLSLNQVSAGRNFKMKPNSLVSVDEDELNYLMNECAGAFKKGYRCRGKRVFRDRLRYRRLGRHGRGCKSPLRFSSFLFKNDLSASAYESYPAGADIPCAFNSK